MGLRYLHIFHISIICIYIALHEHTHLCAGRLLRRRRLQFVFVICFLFLFRKAPTQNMQFNVEFEIVRNFENKKLFTFRMFLVFLIKKDIYANL